MLCIFERQGDQAVCTRCKLTITVPLSIQVETLKAACAKHGLGDWVERQLSRVGITRARYLAVKQWLGLAPVCNCEQRKAIINRFGAWLARLWAAAKTCIRRRQ